MLKMSLSSPESQETDYSGCKVKKIKQEAWRSFWMTEK